jgi:hypothetical protein
LIAAFVTVTENSFSSLHSNRDVSGYIWTNKVEKVLQSHLRTTLFYIPAVNSILVNRLKVNKAHRHHGL